MRKPSPISTSSPRATTISRPCASVSATSASAAAPLFATCAAAAAGTAASSAPTAPAPRGPRSPVARSSSTSHVPAATSSAARAASDSGARPRFVCSSTPVALRTGRSVVAVRGSASSAASTTSAAASAPSPHGLLGGADRGLHPLAPQPGGDVGQPRVGEHRVGARYTRRGSTRILRSSRRDAGTAWGAAGTCPPGTADSRPSPVGRPPVPAASRSSATAPVEPASSPLTSSRRSCAR